MAALAELQCRTFQNFLEKSSLCCHLFFFLCASPHKGKHNLIQIFAETTSASYVAKTTLTNSLAFSLSNNILRLLFVRGAQLQSRPSTTFSKISQQCFYEKKVDANSRLCNFKCFIGSPRGIFCVHPKKRMSVHFIL